MEFKSNDILGHIQAYVAVVGSGGEILYSNREDARSEVLREPEVSGAMNEALKRKTGFGWVEVTIEANIGNREAQKYLAAGEYVEGMGMVVTVIPGVVDCRKCETVNSNMAYIANMSHEIRTPVNAIIGFSRLMYETDDKEKKRRYMDQIETNNHLLLKLVNDVLDLSKKKEGEFGDRKMDVDLNQLMKSIESTVHFRVPPRTVLNSVMGAADCHIETDPERLTQVILNLLTNACKFTQAGSITFGYEVWPESIYFYVRDTGMGIEPEKQHLLFKRYSRQNDEEPGNGLGLSICKEIVERFGGEIGLKSDGPGKGSLFWFTLPVKPIEHEEPIEEMTIQAPEPVAPPRRKDRHRLLVAEDNESNYFLMTSMLEDDYDLIHAWNGREAVEMYSEQKPDLILMDINMPLMDGYEATRHIRQISDSVPIIAVTAYAFSSDRTRIMENGFNSYVSKPVNAERLMSEIKRLLNK